MSNNNKAVVVIKFGGNALNAETGRAFCQTVAKLPAMGFAPVIIHGGGPQINAMLDCVGVESHFVNGLRYTDAETLRIAEMVLSGEVNKMLVQFLGNAGAEAVGLSGKDGKLLIAEKLTQDDNGEPIDLGCVGQIQRVQPALLQTLIAGGFVPVVAPIAYGVDGKTYNINADYAAAAIAKALSAKHFVMMTNISGLLDAEQNVIHHANRADIERLIAEGVIAGGMIPKTLSAVETLTTVGEVNLIDGRQADNLLQVLSGQVLGTRIVA
ncbi:MAG: acetylglutamate kinase [Gammaproteobacteria bacterium]|nr:MAG: acetylglutamate kinase [Gammaproteobacteria bacterium]